MKVHSQFAAILIGGVFAVCIAFLAHGQPKSSRSNASASEQIISQLNEKWLHAFDVADVATLDRTEHEEFTVSGDFGISKKQQHLDRVRQRGPYEFAVNRKTEDQQFRFYGEVAVVTEVDRASTPGGRSSSYQSTSIWVHQGDSWRVIHLHYSKLDENPK
jgi:ketosteroid isomerase-like protein